MVINDTENLRVIDIEPPEQLETSLLNPEQELPEGAESLNMKVRTEVEKQFVNVSGQIAEIKNSLAKFKNIPELLHQLYIKLDQIDERTVKNQERMMAASELMSESSASIAGAVVAIVDQGKRGNELTDKLLTVMTEAFRQSGKNEDRATVLDQRSDDKVSSRAFDKLQRNNFILIVTLTIVSLMFATFALGVTVKGKIPGLGETEISKQDKREVVQETVNAVTPQVEANKTELEALKQEIARLKNASN